MAIDEIKHLRYCYHVLQRRIKAKEAHLPYWQMKLKIASSCCESVIYGGTSQVSRSGTSTNDLCTTEKDINTAVSPIFGQLQADPEHLPSDSAMFSVHYLYSRVSNTRL